MTKPTRTDMVRESTMRRVRTKPKQRVKDEDKQRFQQALRDSVRAVKPQAARPSVTQAATKQAAREIEKREDRGRYQKGREKGEEKEAKKSTDGERRTDAKTAQERVVAKQSLKDDRGGGRGSGGGRGGFEGRRGSKAVHKGLQKGMQGPSLLKLQFAQKLAGTLKGADPAFSQQILNQIVGKVRLLMNSDEEKEIRLELHEKFFKGLKMRVVRKGKGRVTIHLITADSQTREIFQNQQDAIKKALGRKGIEVADFSVT